MSTNPKGDLAAASDGSPGGATDKWRHKDVWSLDGQDFMIQVSRHSVESYREYDDTGPHRWCVYAYIYPKHRLFSTFDGPAMWQDAATALPLHCGPSLLRWHYGDDGKPTSVQVGADYNHLHDDRFTNLATREEAGVVFRDAEELHAHLQVGVE